MESRLDAGVMARVSTRLLWRAVLLICLASMLVGACSISSPGLQPSPTAIFVQIPTDTRRLLPDLTIRGVTVLDDSPNGCPSLSQTRRMIVQVENVGQAPAGQFVVKLNHDQQLVHGGLAAGQTLALSFPGYDSFPEIIVDSTSLVVESDETNNLYFRALDLPTPRPDCASTPTPEIALQKAEIVLEGHSAGVLSVAFSPDGKTIASGSVDDTLRLWSVSQNRLIRTMQGHPFPVGEIKFSPNGVNLFTGSSDGIIRVWQVSSGSMLRSFEGIMGGSAVWIYQTMANGWLAAQRISQCASGACRTARRCKSSMKAWRQLTASLLRRTLRP
jgi:WD40 repeat protein